MNILEREGLSFTTTLYDHDGNVKIFPPGKTIVTFDSHEILPENKFRYRYPVGVKEMISLVMDISKFYTMGADLILYSGIYDVWIICVLIYGFVNNLSYEGVLIKLGNVRITMIQESILRNFLGTYIYTACSNNHLSTCSNFYVKSTRFNLIFKSSEGLYQAYKYMSDINHIVKMSNFRGSSAFHYGERLEGDYYFQNNRVEIMLNIMRDNINTNPILYSTMKDIGLRSINEHGRDPFWSNGINGHGNNMMGKCWKTIMLENLTRLIDVDMGIPVSCF